MRSAASLDTIVVGPRSVWPRAAPMMRLSELVGSRPCSTRRCFWIAVELDLQAARRGRPAPARRASRRGARAGPRWCAARPGRPARRRRAGSSARRAPRRRSAGSRRRRRRTSVTHDGSAIRTDVSSTTRVRMATAGSRPHLRSRSRPPAGDRSTPLLGGSYRQGQVAEVGCETQGAQRRPVVAQIRTTAWWMKPETSCGVTVRCARAAVCRGVPVLRHRRRRRAGRGRAARRRRRRLPRPRAAVPGPRARRARRARRHAARAARRRAVLRARAAHRRRDAGALGAQGTFVANNNVVSQSVAHLHVHVVPRTKGDGLRGFFWPRTKYGDGEAAASRRVCATRSPIVAERLRPASRKGFTARSCRCNRHRCLRAGARPLFDLRGPRARDRSRSRDSAERRCSADHLERGSMATKAELIDAVAASAGVSKADAERTIGAFFDHVTKATKKATRSPGPASVRSARRSGRRAPAATRRPARR